MTHPKAHTHIYSLYQHECGCIHYYDDIDFSIDSLSLSKNESQRRGRHTLWAKNDEYNTVRSITQTTMYTSNKQERIKKSLATKSCDTEAIKSNASQSVLFAI